VDLGSGDGSTRGVIFFFTLSDVTHPESSGESDGDCEQFIRRISWTCVPRYLPEGVGG
jgi:hypothetical protein